MAQQHASTVKIAIWYTIGNVLSRGITFITTPVFTRLLTTNQYGEFSNFTSWISIVLVLATLDLTTSVARAKYDFDERMDQYISSITLFSNIITLLCYIVVECFSGYFCSVFSMDMKYIRFMFLYIMFYPSFSYLQVKHRIYRKYKFFVAFSLGSVIASAAASVLLVVLLDDKLLGRVIGYVVPVTILNLGLWIYIVVKGRHFSKDCIRYACAISIPLIPHALSGILLGNSDRIMIKQMCGAEANALYTLAYQISLLANVLWTSMNQAWAPWLNDNIYEKNYGQIRAKSKIYLGVFSILIIGILLVSPEIILIFGGTAYYEARYVMPPVILSGCFQFIYGMYVNIEIYEKKTFTISIGTVATALLNIGLNMIFIPKFGYIAAAYTTLAGYIALFFFHYIIVHVSIKQLKDIYEKKFIFTIIIILMLASAGALILLDYNKIRYVILAIYTMVFLYAVAKNRNMILKRLKR